MEYDILMVCNPLYDNSKSQLVALVKEAQSKGWRIQGGASVCLESWSHNTRYVMCQTVVRD